MKETLIKYAYSFVGVPYVYSGNNPISGWDCSGFVNEVLKSMGVINWRLDLNAQGIKETLLKTNHESIFPICEEGSILFFGKSKNSVSHVAIALNNKLMIESGGGDSTTTSIDEAKKRGAFTRIRPIRTDLVESIRLIYG